MIMKHRVNFILPFILGVVFASVLLAVCSSYDHSDAAKSLRLGVAASNAQNEPLQSDIADSRQNAITRAIAKVSPAVVSVNVTQVQEYYRGNPFMDDPFWRQFFKYDKVLREVHGLGSGFIFSEQGYVLTNQHVIDKADKIVVTLSGGAKYDAELVGEDYKTDLAVVKIKGDNFSFIALGNSDDIIIGEWSIAIGNPFGLFDISAKPTVTVGVVSAVDLDFGKLENDRQYEDMIQTDAAINPGNSGGPLVNGAGEVIGINTFIYSNGGSEGGNIGLGFAIPVNRVKTVLNDILKYGSVQRDLWTRIQFDDISPTVAFYLRLNTTDGAIVTNVEPNSPWQEAGLESEDVIFEIDGKAVKSKRDIERIKSQLKLTKGDVLSLKVYRNRRVYRADVAF
jgi:serine protease Do